MQIRDDSRMVARESEIFLQWFNKVVSVNNNNNSLSNVQSMETICVCFDC